MIPFSIYLIEKYGLSEEVRKISSDIIAKYIKKNKQPKSLNFTGVFVNKIIFTYNNINNNMGSYDPYKTDFDNKEIHINLQYNFSQPNYKFIYDILVHELTHAVEDINGYNKLKYLLDNEYKTASNYIISRNYADRMTNIMNTFSYIFNSKERNAYMAQLYGDIENIINKNHWTRENINLKVLLNELKKDKIWSVYFSCKDWLSYISNNNLNDKDKDFIVSKYNKLYNENKTFNQILKMMKIKFDKFISKFNSYLPKITFDVLYNNEQKLSS